MAEPRAFGNITSAPRFLAFLVVLVVATLVATRLITSPWLGFMAGFDVAAVVFLAACIPLLSTREEAVIRHRAITNDANKTLQNMQRIDLASVFAQGNTGGTRKVPGVK